MKQQGQQGGPRPQGMQKGAPQQMQQQMQPGSMPAGMQPGLVHMPHRGVQGQGGYAMHMQQQQMARSFQQHPHQHQQQMLMQQQQHQQHQRWLMQQQHHQQQQQHQQALASQASGKGGDGEQGDGGLRNESNKAGGKRQSTVPMPGMSVGVSPMMGYHPGMMMHAQQAHYQQLYMQQQRGGQQRGAPGPGMAGAPSSNPRMHAGGQAPSVKPKKREKKRLLIVDPTTKEEVVAPSKKDEAAEAAVDGGKAAAPAPAADAGAPQPAASVVAAAAPAPAPAATPAATPAPVSVPQSAKPDVAVAGASASAPAGEDTTGAAALESSVATATVRPAPATGAETKAQPMEPPAPAEVQAKTATPTTSAPAVAKLTNEDGARAGSTQAAGEGATAHAGAPQVTSAPRQAQGSGSGHSTSEKAVPGEAPKEEADEVADWEKMTPDDDTPTSPARAVERPAEPEGKRVYTLEVLLALKAANTDLPPNFTKPKVREAFAPGRGGNAKSDRGGGGGRDRGGRDRGGGGQWSRGNAPPEQQREGRRGGRNQRVPADIRGTPLDPNVEVEPLKLGKNRWKPQKATNHLDMVRKTVQGILNKMTKEKFQALSTQLVDIEITSLPVLEILIELVFDKAVTEAYLVDMYAELCKQMSDESAAWSFLKVIHNEDTGKYSWSANANTNTEVIGPFTSPEHCLSHCGAASEDDSLRQSKTDTMELVNLRIRDGVYYKIYEDTGVDESAAGEGDDADVIPRFYVVFEDVNALAENEGLMGSFDDEASALKDAAKMCGFRYRLLNKCQEEFEKENVIKVIEEEWAARTFEGMTPGKIEAEREEFELTRTKMKRRMMGNILFIGELYKQGLLKEKIIRNCTLDLLRLTMVEGDRGNRAFVRSEELNDEESYECLCKLITSVGKTLEDAGGESRKYLELYFHHIGELSTTMELNSRTRFMMMDLIELRSMRWVPRRAVDKSMTLDEIRQKAERDLREKEMQQNRGGRGGRDGRGGGRDRGGRDRDRDYRGGGGRDRGGDVRYNARDGRGGGMSRGLQQQDVRMARGQRGGGGQRGERVAGAMQGGPHQRGQRGGGGGGGNGQSQGRGPQSRGGAPAPQQDRRQPPQRRTPPAQRKPAPAPRAAATPNFAFGPAPAYSGPDMGEDTVKDKLKGVLSDFCHVESDKDAVEAFDELPPQTAGPQAALMLFEKIMDCKPEELPKFEKLLHLLINGRRITARHLAEQLPDLLEFLQDMVIDVPSLPTYFPKILRRLMCLRVSPEEPPVLTAGWLLGVLNRFEETIAADFKRSFFRGIFKDFVEANVPDAAGVIDVGGFDLDELVPGDDIDAQFEEQKAFATGSGEGDAPLWDLFPSLKAKFLVEWVKEPPADADLSEEVGKIKEWFETNVDAKDRGRRSFVEAFVSTILLRRADGEGLPLGPYGPYIESAMTTDEARLGALSGLTKALSRTSRGVDSLEAVLRHFIQRRIATKPALAQWLELTRDAQMREQLSRLVDRCSK